MSERTCLSIILAAGEGTRMKSAVPKVLHKVAGLSMVGHVVKAAFGAGSTCVAAVVGHGSEAVADEVRMISPDAAIFVQGERLGTAHAVLAAREAVATGYDDILVMFGDTPLVEPEALGRARALLAEGAAVSVMGFRTDRPNGYGRLIEKDGELEAIREERDCTPEERAINFCNGGLMAIDGRLALELIEAVGNGNAKGEYYLTDIVEIARARGLHVGATEVAFDNVLGVNTMVELAEAEAVWQARRRQHLLLSGVSMIDPATVYLSHDTEIGRDALIEPNVYFGPGVSVGRGAIVHAFSHLTQAVVGEGAEIGPFARLRPGAELAEGSKVGNFCEIKAARIGPGAKVNHLSYIGDASIGAKSNIGAGTITCNYDGYNKHLTQIGAGAFIGSNTSLVAPVSVGDSAYVASGSVITDNVPNDALAFGRARQTVKEGRAGELRVRYQAEKDRRLAEKSKA